MLKRQQLALIHAAFHRSGNRFVLLSGLSGTGKTQLMIRYMKAYLNLLDLDDEDHFKLVAVTPAFRDPTPLLGYYNSLHADKPYVPGELTELLIAADANPDKPYFLIMDEMNLARVEYYFAPLLSAMESGNGIAFHHQPQPVDAVPSKLSGWPKNIFLCGTVNMDETTHAFSDKVLDRAFTFEFWDVDLPGYFARNPAAPAVQTALQDFYDELRLVNLHFGYRTLRAVCDFVGRRTSSTLPRPSHLLKGPAQASRSAQRSVGCGTG